MIGLRELRAKTPEGICPFCGDPAKPCSQSRAAVQKRRQRKAKGFFGSCGGPECKTAYFRLYARDYRAVRHG